LGAQPTRWVWFLCLLRSPPTTGKYIWRVKVKLTAHIFVGEAYIFSGLDTGE
jgi:hypothetical protein